LEKIFFGNFFLKLYKNQRSRPLGLKINIRDQALYDHYIKKLIKPKEKKFLVPKGHFHFTKFANFRPPPCFKLEKPDHETYSEMLALSCSFGIWALSDGRLEFFKIFDFKVDHF